MKGNGKVLIRVQRQCIDMKGDGRALNSNGNALIAVCIIDKNSLDVLRQGKENSGIAKDKP